MSHDGHLADKHFGSRVWTKLYRAALTDEAPPEPAMFKGFYAALVATLA